MIIKSLELQDYRNYEYLELSFDKGTNILYGDNAQVKQIYWKQSIYQQLQNLIRVQKIRIL